MEPLKCEGDPTAAPSRRRRARASLHVASGAAAGASVESPARRLQDDLNRSLSDRVDDNRRWAPRTTLIVCGLAAAGLWLVMGLAVREALRHVL